MADCLQYLAAGVLNYNVSDKSDLYKDIQDTIGVRNVSVGVGQMDPPTIGSVVFDIDSPDKQKVGLDRPQKSFVTPPTMEVQLPSLEEVTYKAVQPVIDYVFHDKPIADISYESSVKPVRPNYRHAQRPPLDYPTVDRGEIPAPDNYYTAPPKIDFGKKPTLPTIIPETFNEPELAPLDISDLLPDPPDVQIDPLEFQERLKYDEDLELKDQVLQVLSSRYPGRRDWYRLQGVLLEGDVSTLKREVREATEKVFEDAAKRNFSSSYGLVDKAHARIYEAEHEKRLAASEKIRIELRDRAHEIVLTCMTTAFKIEQNHFRLYMRYIRQNVKVYAHNLRLAERAYNLVLELYKTRERIVATQIQAYNNYVRAVAQQNDAVNAEIEFQAALNAVYRAKADMHAADARTQGHMARVAAIDAEQQRLPLDAYASQLRGEVKNLSLVRQNIQSYREAINAYSQYYQWFDSAMQARESEVNAVTSQVAVTQEKLQAYEQLWRHEGARSSAYEQYLSASTSAMDSELQNFRAAVSAQRDYLNVALQALGDSRTAVGSYARASATAAQDADNFNSANIAYTDAERSIEVADAQRATAEEALSADTQVQLARLDMAYEEARLRSAGALSQAGSSIFQTNVQARGTSAHRVSGRDGGDVRASAQQRRTFDKRCTYVVQPATTG